MFLFILFTNMKTSLEENYKFFKSKNNAFVEIKTPPVISMQYGHNSKL